ncbi:MAG: geranylgeranyl reductase family protein [Xenococcaceae cyanobacterium]
MFDCIIIGAGPAGTTAAYHLAKKGHSVLILEKASFPRYKPCGGGVSPAIAKWFDFDFSPVIDNTVTKVKYTWKLDDPIEVGLQDVQPMWMVRRDVFDNFLAEQAQKSGAQLQDNTEVTGINLKGDRWQVTTNNGTFEASYLIAADGANGPTTKWLGLAERPKFVSCALEVSADIPADKKNLAYFDFGSVKNGFLWSFPKSNGYSISGAFVKGKGKVQDLQKQLENYANYLGANPANGKYSECVMNLWTENQPMHTDRALLAGEAAGMADPLTGEGIRPAIFTGLKAADAIAAALAKEAGALANYTQIINEQWASDLVWAGRLSGMFHQFPKIAYKVGVKRPSAAQLMGKILCGELRYSEVTDRAMKRIKSSLIPGMGG